MAEPLASTMRQSVGRPRESSEALASTLDDLLVRYLHLLDQHQKLRQELNRLLSDGYLSLAQANFSNPNRIRYGQDYYDDRMQASTLVSSNLSHPCFSVMKPGATDPTKVLVNDVVGDHEESKTTAGTSEAIVDEKCKASGLPCDPLNWFGILVPPGLRASQSNFQSAVIDIIPALASTTNEMKEVEIEVRRARKWLKKAG
ncbi:hypothetical protein JMJ35_007471 [Cladonia borealis]|uniref:Vacuolar ATPase assembly protein VMA22 n=1 Tax=Cladonia borealis TaxID=184061 RepID=A0AA39QVN3_9LECA|nr:hypothetical protein JMJ35_007471 [Cladonia borealis]